jgi:hypothetical protein
MVPAWPLKAAGEPPPKEIRPWELEKTGSFVHKLKTELVLDMLATESWLGSKLIVPSAALTGLPPLFILTKSEKVLFNW